MGDRPPRLAKIDRIDKITGEERAGFDVDGLPKNNRIDKII